LEPVQPRGDWPRKRLIILGVILVAIFVVWLAPPHFVSDAKMGTRVRIGTIWRAQVSIREIHHGKGKSKPLAPGCVPGALLEINFCDIPYR